METTVAALYESGSQIGFLRDQEIALRQRPPEPVLYEALLDQTRLLELALVFVAVHEAIGRLGLKTVADVIMNTEKIDELVETICRLKPGVVFQENSARLEPLRRLPVSASAPATGSTEDVLRGVRSLLLYCPADLPQHLAGSAHPEVAHRYATAHAGLRAFIARHSHPEKHVLIVVGQAYAEGRLSIDEVATVLGVAVSDAVALLEEQGCRPSIEGLRLGAEDRARRLARIREDRLAREGKPRLDRQLVVREVIASQRIEDIDARAWLSR